MEHDEEDEDRDFIAADGEDRNGTRGNNLFARGVVDRYRLAVFRKGSTPNGTGSGVPGEAAGQSALDSPHTPCPSTKERRGRTGSPQSARTTLGQPSLKSKESTISVNSLGLSSKW